ncbi:M20/M25/M40 family metallo-hydrolase [Aequorivita antarctica]|uniref:Carboxypeptidase Q n=1 Tax=Aequorivita antarctica TaxID=153266 RepID=A0A5C6YXB0_9FLAO|nr:M20/M25/M40 family metallo-hydrolase [Aequorivita antarctica]TXD72337.1 M20/M25/M40 family metallo-hydrolase [Aequorivita antarctica]SRX74478.1 Leupeptin-inactivating enzyme 1 [Aequorivita antarctica]
MKTISKILIPLFFLIGFVTSSQTLPQALAKINTEGFQKSQVMNLITDLSDVYGPRLTGTNQYFTAAEWAKKTLENWGMDKVYFEKYCNDCMGWEVNSFNVEMTSPAYMKIQAYPYAWTESSNGVQIGELIWIESHADLEKVKKQWSGKLKGKTILMGAVPEQNMLFDALSKRFAEDQIEQAEKSIVTSLKNALDPSASDDNLIEDDKGFEIYKRKDDAFFAFLKEEGVLSVFDSRALFPGIIHPGGTYNYKESDAKPIPYFAISPENFGKLQRLITRNMNPKIKFNLDSKLYLKPENNVNIIGEITGSDPTLKDEVVMIGAHFDSWHAASGSTDNGAGSAVMMEVMRIIKAAGLKPKRTIRIALWGGEEQGYLGSEAYAEHHYGKIMETTRKKEVEKISAYINMDNGAGKMRGIFLQGNEAVRPIFEEMLKPYAYLDVNAFTIENTGGTDHVVFDYYKIPGFQIIQDPLNYETVTHHTNLDVLEYVPERDMMVNATVIAALVYQIAQEDSRLPRED